MSGAKTFTQPPTAQDDFLNSIKNPGSMRECVALGVLELVESVDVVVEGVGEALGDVTALVLGLMPNDGVGVALGRGIVIFRGKTENQRVVCHTMFPLSKSASVVFAMRPATAF